MRIEETVYAGRDNSIVLQLSSDGIVIQHNTLTRCQVVVGATVIDSATQPTWFNFSSVDRLVLKLGQSGLVAGLYKAQIVVFDTDHSNGLVWGEMALTVKAS